MLSVVKHKIQQGSPLVERRATLAGAVIVAGWPVARWFVARIGDGSDEPMGLLALAAALIFAPRLGWSQPVSAARRWALVCVLSGYIVSFPFLPPLGHALLWIAGLGLVAAPSGYALAWTTLLVLSLPFVATLQFYLGYPLRCITTKAAALLLNLVGIHAAGEGIVLRWAGERVLIDAPCSGIQMLWTILLVSAVLANARQMGGRATFQLFRFAGLAVFVANTLRAAVLSCIEIGLCPRPPFGHEGVGLGLFAAAAAALLWRCERLAGGSTVKSKNLHRGTVCRPCANTGEASDVTPDGFPFHTRRSGTQGSR